MKKSALALLLCTAMLGHSFPARALDVTATPAMQACNTDADCTVADGVCGKACGVVPLNSKYLQAFQSQKVATCGASSSDEPSCQTVPPLNPTCIHNRCTIGTAYKEHADAADYGSAGVKPSKVQLQEESAEASSAQGAAAIAPAAGGSHTAQDTDSSASSGTASPADDKHGFTAYDLPNHGASTMGTLGTVTSTP